jgi:hypothetical protein
MTLWPLMQISPGLPDLGDDLAFAVDQAELDAPDRPADRAGLLGAARVERRHRRGLRQAVALEDIGAELPVEGGHDLDRHRGAARQALAQGRQHRRGDVGVVEQREVHRRHAGEDVDAVLGDELRRADRLEARHEHERAAGEERRVLHHGLAEAVEQRQDHHHHRLGQRTPASAAGSATAR